MAIIGLKPLGGLMEARLIIEVDGDLEKVTGALGMADLEISSLQVAYENYTQLSDFIQQTPKEEAESGDSLALILILASVLAVGILGLTAWALRRKCWDRDSSWRKDSISNEILGDEMGQHRNSKSDLGAYAPE